MLQTSCLSTSEPTSSAAESEQKTKQLESMAGICYSQGQFSWMNERARTVSPSPFGRLEPSSGYTWSTLDSSSHSVIRAVSTLT